MTNSINDFLKNKVLNEKLKELSQLPSFNKRINFCKNNFEYICGGTARKVFGINENFVLKLAYNEKGLAQNEVENDFYLQGLSFVNKIHDSCSNGSWLIFDRVKTFKSKKQLKNNIEKSLGLDFESFINILEVKDKYTSGNNSEHSSFMDCYRKIEEKNEKDFNKNREDFLDMLGNTDLMCGDFTRFSSWGLDNNNQLKLVDYGLSKEVFKEYYKTKKNKLMY